MALAIYMWCLGYSSPTCSLLQLRCCFTKAACRPPLSSTAKRDFSNSFQLAAPLPENRDRRDSFYCTKDSPLLNDLFGHFVEESVYVKKSHDCSKFQLACQRCFQQVNLRSQSVDGRDNSRFASLFNSDIPSMSYSGFFSMQTQVF